MDELIEVLNAQSEIEDGRPIFELVNTSRIIRVTALTREEFDEPDSAYAAARELVSALLARGYEPVNRAEIGAHCELLFQRTRWRGSVTIALWPSESLNGDHDIVPGLST